MQETILEMRNINKEFPGVKALTNIDFELKKGTIHAIVGENGAGKSTLMKILSGMLQADSGEIIIKGDKVDIDSTKKAINLGISMMYQELSSILEMTIVDNMFLGREIVKGRYLQRKKMREETVRILKSMDLDFHPLMKLKSLSIANRQMIEIAKAINSEAEIIVMDEPTSAISQKEVFELFKLIKVLKEKGISIIYISHRLEELPHIADEITIIRDGEKIKTTAMDKITKEEIINLMVGREMSNLFPKTFAKIGKTVMKVSGFSDHKRYFDINFEARQGEVLGIYGLVGAGRTELARSIFGLDERESGTVELEGKEIQIKNPRDAIDAGVVMISEDRKRYGLVLCRSLRENITLSHLNKYSNKIGFMKSKKEIKDIGDQFKLLKIKASGIQMLAYNLSGGNQQKAVLAKWMIEKPKVLIMDEPTRGIDVGSKYEIYKLICEFAAQGMAVVMISSELPEILGISDRILCMADGRLKCEFSREEATQQKIMNVCAGGK